MLRLVLLAGGALFVPLANAQQPLFTFVQVSDSQPQTSSENQRFVDVLRVIAESGQPGKLLPYRVDLVLFAGDITWGNTRSEWTAAKLKLDTWLTANDIPFLAVPGNHDVDDSDTSLYEEFIADSGVWDRGSASFTGHNGESRTTGWRGLRFIGVNNSNPGYNMVSSSDVSQVAARVDAANAAQENAFILCHHPHNESSRMPLASVLPRPAVLGYCHGHSGNPAVRHGLSGVSNPNVYETNTNAIYEDRCLIYYQVFPTSVRAHVVILDNNPSSLPSGTTIPLVHAMVQTSDGNPGTSVTFRPIADTRVSESSPSSTSNGTSSSLRVKTQAGSSYQSFLRFDLGTLSGIVTAVKLRLYCTDASSGGGSVYRITSNSWGETTTSWNNKPALPASPLASFGAVQENTWYEVQLGAGAVNSGLVSLALAGGTSNSVYWASRETSQKPELVVTFAPPAPVAAFSAAPRSGSTPLTVVFTDSSTGGPSSWLWDFGDGSTSTQRNPSHVYSQVGQYTVSLTATNAGGSNELVRAAYVTVENAPPVRTFLPVADARVSEGSPNSNAGADSVLRVKQETGGSYHSYLRFDLSSLSGNVVSARLRLFATDGSNVAGRVFRTSSTWSESTVNWNNRPAPTGSMITSIGTVGNNAWAEFDITPAVVAGGQLDLVLQSSSSNSCYYSSREGAQPPQLVITTAAP